jgi:hypothetical protein
MTHRSAHSVRKWCRAYLSAAVCLGMFGHNAAAETIAHLTQNVWGCVDPNVTPSINDTSDPGHLDPKWVVRAITEGKCIRLTPVGQWATLSQDHNGLTYVGARGTAGPSRFVLGPYFGIGRRSSLGTSSGTGTTSRTDASANRSESAASGDGTF